MSGSIDERRDALAARALSRLPEPPVPAGLAARITAKAIATPQAQPQAEEADRPARTETAAAVVAHNSAPRRRWPGYAMAVSVAIVALASAGLLLAGDDPQEPRVAGAAPEPAAPPRRVEVADVPAPARAVTPRTAPEPPARRARPAAPPAPSEPAPVELAVEEAPAPAAKAPEPQLVQTGPQLPQSGLGSIDGSVYGPPAPSGLGVAGSVPGGKAPPGATSAPPTSTPPPPGRARPRGGGPMRR